MTSNAPPRTSMLAPCLAGFIAALVFISGDSLWIDEGNAAYKAMQGGLGDWYRALVTQGGSDAQMPGYMLYIWAWEKVFGSSEYWLRCSNLPFLLIALCALRRLPYSWIALLTSPFVLYYLNELRPYLMQVAGAAVVLGSLATGSSQTLPRWRWFLVGNLILCASSLTGVLWSAGALIGLLGLHHSILRVRGFWIDLAWSSPVFLLMGGYYIKTLLLGQSAALMGGSVWLSLAACGYELAGLMGLGPGRIELRENPASVLGYAWLLATGGVIFGIAYLWGGIRILGRLSKRQIAWTIVILAVPMAALLILVVFKDFRLLARHIAPLSVLLAACVGELLRSHIQRPGLRNGALVFGMLAVAVGLVSAISLRFATRHKKDAYQDAARIAKVALSEGKEVYWSADGPTAHYYGLNPATKGFHFASAKQEIQLLPDSAVFIMTKPDIVDPNGRIRRELAASRYRVVQVLQAFTIWRKDSPNTN